MSHLFRHLPWSAVVLATCVASADAQTDRALERRLDRNERQLQRQVNQADYYTNEAWQQLSPWVQQAGISPIARAANAARATANVAGNAVKQSLDAANASLDGQFGFNDQNQANAWFYDYYTYTPTYYYGPQNSDRYAGAIRYFDADNDGVFESHAYYRDSDRDGIYDEYDRLDFYSQEQVQPQTNVPTQAPRYVGPADARRYKVEGAIGLTKTAKVNGRDHLIVGLKETSESTLAIDVGPVDLMQGRQIEVGRSLVAVGAMEQIGDKKILVADTLRIEGGETIQIERGADLVVSGSIVDITEVTIGSQQHYMAIVEFEGQRQLVDLGPSSAYKVKLQPATQIVVYGVPVQTHDHRVLMANRVRLGQEVIPINRTERFAF